MAFPLTIKYVGLFVSLQERNEVVCTVFLIVFVVVGWWWKKNVSVIIFSQKQALRHA